MSSNGQVAFVTGGTRGIGAAITTMLARDGVRVAAGYSCGADAANTLKARLEGEGGTVSVHQGRVDTMDDCRRVVDEAMKEHGRIDFLINNAGITIDKTVRKMTDEDWNMVLAVNLSGAFRMTKSVLEHMIERGSGRIVNISSVIGELRSVESRTRWIDQEPRARDGAAWDHGQRRRPGLHRNRDGGGDTERNPR